MVKKIYCNDTKITYNVGVLIPPPPPKTPKKVKISDLGL